MIHIAEHISWIWLKSQLFKNSFPRYDIEQTKVKVPTIKRLSWSAKHLEQDTAKIVYGLSVTSSQLSSVEDVLSDVICTITVYIPCDQWGDHWFEGQQSPNPYSSIYTSEVLYGVAELSLCRNHPLDPAEVQRHPLRSTEWTFGRELDTPSGLKLLSTWQMSEEKVQTNCLCLDSPHWLKCLMSTVLYVQQKTNCWTVWRANDLLPLAYTLHVFIGASVTNAYNAKMIVVLVDKCVAKHGISQWLVMHTASQVWATIVFKLFNKLIITSRFTVHLIFFPTEK